MAIDFAGDDDYVDCGSSAGIDDIQTLSIAAWINVDAFTGSDNIAAKDGATGNHWSFFCSSIAAGDNRIAFYIDWATTDGAWRTTNTCLTSGTWTHVGVTYSKASSNNDAAFYVNGVAVASSEYGTPTGSSTTDAANTLRIAYNGYLDGRVEDIRIYGRTLSAQEFSVLAGGYRGPLGDELIWLPMDGPSAALSTGAANVFDMSGNGNHGTPQGGGAYIESYAPRMSGWIP